MNGLNKVMLIGTVGSDPETKIINENLRVTSFRIVTNETFLDKATGTKKENAEWHNVEAWNSLSDTVSMYFKKGTNVYVEGKIKTDVYDDKDGKKVYRTKISMESFLFTGNKKTDEQQPGQTQQAPVQYAQVPQQAPVQYAQAPQQAPQQAPVQYAQVPQQAPIQQAPQQVPIQNYMTDAEFRNGMNAPDDLPF
jgi:single-strand DNA-binding protein